MLQNKLKRKGGAEKNRDKKRKELLEESKTCLKLDSMFKNVEKKDNVVLVNQSSDTEKKDNAILPIQSSVNEINSYKSVPDGELSNNIPNNSIINYEESYLAKENKKQDNILDEDEIRKDNFNIDLKHTINKPDAFNYFKKPKYQNIEDFFEFHPYQPKDHIFPSIHKKLITQQIINVYGYLILQN